MQGPFWINNVYFTYIYTVKPPIKRPPPPFLQGNGLKQVQLYIKSTNFKTYNFSKAVNPKKLAAAKTPTTSASLTFISHSFSYNAERARAKAEK